MDLQKIISATLLAGANLPAFKALFDTVVDTFGEQDQVKLKDAYAKAIAGSDAAHRDAQGL
jgi:hypothetical protein